MNTWWAPVTPAWSRLAGALALTAGIWLLAAGCGGRPAPTASAGVSNPGGSANSGLVAYSRCVRSHGVPHFPDPNGSGELPKGDARRFGVSTAQYQTALQACQHLLPNGDGAFTASLDQCLMTGDCPAAVVQRALTEGQTFAQCMRNDRVPNWPDPTLDSEGRPSFQTTAAGISIASTRSGPILAKIGHCQSQPAAVLLRLE